VLHSRNWQLYFCVLAPVGFSVELPRDVFIRNTEGSLARAIRIADTAGVFGAIFAAVCCAGAPIILSVLAAIGLSALRTDAILIPLMCVSLGIALWGFWTDRRLHRASGPMLLATVGAVMLIAGVIFIHGLTARVFIGAASIALVIATVANIGLRHACNVSRSA
jgi:mercuric ion transport protein